MCNDHRQPANPIRGKLRRKLPLMEPYIQKGDGQAPSALVAASGRSPETHSKHFCEIKPKPIKPVIKSCQTDGSVPKYRQPNAACGKFHKTLHRASPSESKGETGRAWMCMYITNTSALFYFLLLTVKRSREF